MTEVKEKKRQLKYYYGCGKRKCAIARVKISQNGSGEIKINEKSLQDYCKEKINNEIIVSPLVATETLKSMDVKVEVYGGGQRSQSEAIRHGIAKALLSFNELLKPILRKQKFLTRDSRVKERKKYGLKGARRAPQFSKR